MIRSAHVIEPVVSQVQLPPGVLGPDAVSFEVRCFVVPRADYVVIIDVGPPGTSTAIENALHRVGAMWSDVSDILLTHSHFDHVGDLAAVNARAPSANVWAGAADVREIHAQGGALRVLRDGDRVRDLAVLATPGHTAGHVSVLDEPNSLVVVGDAVGNQGGTLTYGPPAFTADAHQARTSLERLATLSVERVLFSHGPEISHPNRAMRELLARRE